MQIDPKRAIPRAEHERTAKVFVGGLAPPVTSESLKDFLGQFGQVMDATVMFDRETGRSKGFAFATFADEEAVNVAMAASGIELEGRQVSIIPPSYRGTLRSQHNACSVTDSSDRDQTSSAARCRHTPQQVPRQQQQPEPKPDGRP